MQLPLRQQIAQMLVVRASGYLLDGQIRYPAWEPPVATLRYWLSELHLGGVILLGGSSGELALRVKQLQSWAKIPLLVAADIEEGVGQRFPGATWFPPPMALAQMAIKNLEQAKHYAFLMGAITAKEAQCVGINWVLAPVVDVNNNPDNPVINVRSFGDTPEVVAALTSAFIKGAQTYPVLTTAKHFPGHGDTAVDSHLELPVLPHDRERLAQVELIPFERAIATGVDSIMSAHLLIPSLDAHNPATLSHPILTECLRGELGFDGLIVTDALIMGGMTKFASPEEVVVRAIEAGADVLLMPEDPLKAIDAVEKAVSEGRISETRIAESLTRISRVKKKVFSKDGDLGLLWDLAQPQAVESAIAIMEHSLQVTGITPITPSRGKNLIVVDDLLRSEFLGHHTPALTIPQQLGYSSQILDHHHACNVDTSKPILLQVFLRANPFRGTAGLTPQAQEFYLALIATAKIEAMVLYGSPYVLKWFESHLYGCPSVFSYAQTPEAQRIALQVLFPSSVATIKGDF